MLFAPQAMHSSPSEILETMTGGQSHRRHIWSSSQKCTYTTRKQGGAVAGHMALFAPHQCIALLFTQSHQDAEGVLAQMSRQKFSADHRC